MIESSWLVAIDPGIKPLGYAVLWEGTLVRAGVSRTKAHWLHRAAVEHGDFLVRTLGLWDMPVVCERMVHRRARGVPPQDLMDVNLIAGAVASRVAHSQPYVFVTPKEWKGSTPREVEQARTRAALSPSELAILEAVKPKSLAHNAWSAVGIGLSHIGRAHVTIKKSLTY